MYIVKATNHSGPVTFACGTADQALDRAGELISRAFEEVRIIDPKGKEWTHAALDQAVG